MNGAEEREVGAEGFLSTDPFKRWECVLCGHIYDEADGSPEEGISPGTRWADVPDSWICPICGAAKAEFVMVEIG